eukprot:gnl/TRDRNA2_/TRDRNA2_45007_c0_seq1.p1 gnl/TRDRNA2_/TRDRNA2_45007_c0~~gnl/TRDRNA2_/TRDRNA2_45007_c0_seq1.p1  ORF type:complete len:656 (-),score=79.98 gnl/TRDRNA2_/TRDRNA2_45007_c0_seq1:70-2037(-)
MMVRTYSRSSQSNIALLCAVATAVSFAGVTAQERRGDPHSGREKREEVERRKRERDDLLLRKYQKEFEYDPKKDEILHGRYMNDEYDRKKEQAEQLMEQEEKERGREPLLGRKHYGDGEEGEEEDFNFPGLEDWLLPFDQLGSGGQGGAGAVDWSLAGKGHCNSGYVPYGGTCYKISKKMATFTQCVQEVCAEDGGTLATISTDGLAEFLWQLIIFSGGTEQYGTFIGLYQDMSDPQVDSWEWADGSQVNYTDWHIGEPQGSVGCASVSCAAMIPTCFWCEDPSTPRIRGWDDISCIREQHCLCQQGSHPSASFMKSARNLDWPGFITWATPIYFALGWPCLILLVWALVGTMLVTRRPMGHPGRNEFISTVPSRHPSQAYGNLLESHNEWDVDSLVHSWLVRGGCSAMCYAVVVLILAFTTAVQNRGVMIRIFINAFEALVMAGCKLAVGLSALFVHQNLSSISRAMAGPWILILAVSKMAMALAALLMCFGYLDLAGSYEVCGALSLFTWSCTIAMIFQSLAGFSLFRVYYRTVRRVGDREVFAKVVGGWWSALVGSTFGVGIGFWWCGARLLTDADYALLEIPFLLVLTACCQVTAGLSIVRTNSLIRSYFKSPEGKAKFAELSERVRQEFTTDSGSEMRTRIGHSQAAMEI